MSVNPAAGLWLFQLESAEVVNDMEAMNAAAAKEKIAKLRER